MAINFPNSPSVNDQHTASGVTWTWDGTTWKADGVTSSYVLPAATTNALGGIKVGTGLSIASSGTLSLTTLGSLTDVSTSGVSSGEILKFNGTSWAPAADDSSSALTIKDEGVDKTTAATSIDFVGAGVTATNSGTNVTVTIPGGGGGSGLQTRTSANATTASLANDASADLTIVAAKTYVLHKIETDRAAWVVLYTDGTARTADSGRNITTDPNPGSGVIAEVITTGAQTQSITPGTIGWNNDGTPSTNAYLKVVNKSGATGTVQVTLHFLQLEA